MAWKNGYYYRNQRKGGRVITEYVGAGPLAALIAQYDAIERQKRQQEREAWQAIIDEENAIDERIDVIGAALDALVEAALLISGHHTHKRQWRKRNDRRTDRN